MRSTLESTPTNNDSRSFIPEIQGLRGVAVLAVVAYHYAPERLPGGFVGVDAFFVVSGYVVTRLLLREKADTGRVDLGAFYARRLRRLLPLSATVIACTLVAALVWFGPHRQTEIGKDATFAALYASNLLFASQATDYQHPGATPSPLLHFWSLSLEEQFYLLWPLLVAVATGVGGNISRLKGILSAIAAASFAASVYLLGDYQPWAFYGLPTRAWEFAVGAALAIGPDARPGGSPSHRASGLWGWAGLGALAVACLRYNDDTPFPGLYAALPVAATALIVWAVRASPTEQESLSAAWLRTTLTNPLLTFIGETSYALYLWHWPILVLYETYWNRAATTEERWGLIQAAVAVAFTSHYFIEKPLLIKNRPLAVAQNTAICPPVWS